MRISGEKREESIFFFRDAEVRSRKKFSNFSICRDAKQRGKFFNFSKVRDAEVRNSKMRRADVLEKLVIRGMLEGGPS